MCIGFKFRNGYERYIFFLYIHSWKEIFFFVFYFYFYFPKQCTADYSCEACGLWMLPILQCYVDMELSELVQVGYIDSDRLTFVFLQKLAHVTENNWVLLEYLCKQINLF